jgi:hypothetical protein
MLVSRRNSRESQDLLAQWREYNRTKAVCIQNVGWLESGHGVSGNYLQPRTYKASGKEDVSMLTPYLETTSGTAPTYMDEPKYTVKEYKLGL